MSFARPSLNALDVLVVDDNASMRALLTRVMDAAGVASLRAAHDAPSALAMHAERPAHLLIVDHTMPGMSGAELVRRLRADPASNVRIIMLSGHGEARHLAEVRAAGVDEVLVKPISVRDLLERIEAVFQAVAD